MASNDNNIKVGGRQVRVEYENFAKNWNVSNLPNDEHWTKLIDAFNLPNEERNNTPIPALIKQALTKVRERTGEKLIPFATRLGIANTALTRSRGYILGGRAIGNILKNFGADAEPLDQLRRLLEDATGTPPLPPVPGEPDNKLTLGEERARALFSDQEGRLDREAIGNHLGILKRADRKKAIEKHINRLGAQTPEAAEDFQQSALRIRAEAEKANADKALADQAVSENASGDSTFTSRVFRDAGEIEVN